MNEVIEHLMRMKDSSDSDDLLTVPDFEEKIVFNKLSVRVADMLRSASYQVGGLEAYFRCHSEITKSEIQKKMVDSEDLFIIGFADGYHEAVKLVERITQDVLDATGSANIRGYLLEKQREFEERNEKV